MKAIFCKRYEVSLLPESETIKGCRRTEEKSLVHNCCFESEETNLLRKESRTTEQN